MVLPHQQLLNGGLITRKVLIMSRKISAKKQKSVIDVYKRFPTLDIKIIAAQHGICTASASRLINDHILKQEKKKKAQTDEQ